jgi:tetratricopeptide (TPR) repeat protein
MFEHRGWAYYFSDANAFALRDFTRAIELAPDGSSAYIGRGLVYVKMGKYRDAVKDAETALRDKPIGPDMMHNLACVFAQAAAAVERDLGQPERARLATDYRNRAVSFVEKTLEMIPEPQRQAFWREHILPDSALTPIHGEAVFKQIKERFRSP